MKSCVAGHTPMAAIQMDVARGSEHSFQCLPENSPSLLQSRHCLAFEQENLSNAVDREGDRTKTQPATKWAIDRELFVVFSLSQHHGQSTVVTGERERKTKRRLSSHVAVKALLFCVNGALITGHGT